MNGFYDDRDEFFKSLGIPKVWQNTYENENGDILTTDGYFITNRYDDDWEDKLDQYADDWENSNWPNSNWKKIDSKTRPSEAY